MSMRFEWVICFLVQPDKSVSVFKQVNGRQDRFDSVIEMMKLLYSDYKNMTPEI